jgi:hypothetical protein
VDRIYWYTLHSQVWRRFDARLRIFDVVWFRNQTITIYTLSEFLAFAIQLEIKTSDSDLSLLRVFNSLELKGFTAPRHRHQIVTFTNVRNCSSLQIIQTKDQLGCFLFWISDWLVVTISTWYTSWSSRGLMLDFVFARDYARYQHYIWDNNIPITLSLKPKPTASKDRVQMIRVRQQKNTVSESDDWAKVKLVERNLTRCMGRVKPGTGTASSYR